MKFENIILYSTLFRLEHFKIIITLYFYTLQSSYYKCPHQEITRQQYRVRKLKCCDCPGPKQGRGERVGWVGRCFLGSAKIEKKFNWKHQKPTQTSKRWNYFCFFLSLMIVWGSFFVPFSSTTPILPNFTKFQLATALWLSFIEWLSQISLKIKSF